MIIVFNVPGKVVPKARPRVTRVGHTYTPQRTRDYEDHIVGCYLEKYPGGETMPGRLTLMLTHQAGKNKDGSIPKRPTDLDNVVKIVMDALEGILYESDSHFDRIHAVRYWVDYGKDHLFIRILRDKP